MKTNATTIEVVEFNNEEGFNNGFYVIEVNNSDRHVIYQSACFKTKAEAEIALSNY